MTADARRAVIEDAAIEVFAEHGYHAASMDEIAARSGVTVPVVYDHFDSKQDLHRRLLERHFAELRGIWAKRPTVQEPELRLSLALDAWFSYVQSHRYAWRMLFSESTGDPEVAAIHREVAAESRAAVMPLLASSPGVENIIDPERGESLEMVWEIMRAVLQGLALWWYEHQHVPRERIIATAMSALWVGFERAQRGETWKP
jgi:AcrR family transcriptional regulator